MDDNITVVGRLGNDPLRNETTGGVPVVNFRLASGRRRYDKQEGKWKEAGVNWFTVSAYRDLAEHIATSLKVGQQVIVTGRVQVREWKRRDGSDGTSIDIEAEAVGHDLRWGTTQLVSTKKPQQTETATATAEPPQAPVEDPVRPPAEEIFEPDSLAPQPEATAWA